MLYRIRYAVKRVSDESWIIEDLETKRPVETYEDPNEAFTACGIINYQVSSLPTLLTDLLLPELV